MRVPGVGPRLVKRVQRAKNSLKQLLIPGMLFEDMGITYLGPIDGHNIREVERTIEEAKKIDHAVLVHVLTTKGKGYAPAEKNPAHYHGVSPFDQKTGKALSPSKESYTSVFSKTLCRLARENKKIVGITAAMPDGTGLSAFAKEFPDRFFDVGIAEQHAVTCAAGMASNGLKPVFAVYSSFLQRAYDQIVHDVCLQKLPVVFGIDRAEGVLHARPNGCLRLCGNLLPHDVVHHGGKKVVVHGALNVPHAVDDRRELLVLFP